LLGQEFVRGHEVLRPNRPVPGGTRRTLQLATVAEDTDLVSVGLRNFPVHKLVLICEAQHRRHVDEFATSLRSLLHIPVQIREVGKPLLENVLEGFAEILRENQRDFEDVVVNVAGGDRILGCAAISAAFANGLKAFGVDGDMPMMLPILKMSYQEMVSKPKLDILRAIKRAGGEVESLKQLSELAGYGKPLLSYHVQGAEDSRGLVDLGLVDVDRVRRGRTIIRLTALGKLLLLGS
jgi:hypothetical protein